MISAKRELLVYGLCIACCFFALGLLLFLGSRAAPSVDTSLQSPQEAPKAIARPSKVHDEKLAAIARRGRAIVESIYRFKQTNGLWPASLKDLGSDGFTAEELSDWRLNWQSNGWWQLINYGGFPDWAVSYTVGGNDHGWVVTDGIDAAPLDVEQPLPLPRKLTEEELRRNQLFELVRRTRSQPPQIIHYQGLITFHYKRKEFAEARAACKECLSHWPDHWWPNMMLGRIDVERSAAAESETRIQKWVAGHNDFTHYYFLAAFYHDARQKEQAQAALREAANHPLANWHHPSGTGEIYDTGATFFAWEGAMIAYREKWFDIALAVCDQWQKFVEVEQGYGDSGYDAVRAACYLNQGEYDKAADQMVRCRDHERGHYRWALNLDLLKEAVNTKTKSFQYAPEGVPSEPELLIDYQ